MPASNLKSPFKVILVVLILSSLTYAVVSYFRGDFNLQDTAVFAVVFAVAYLIFRYSLAHLIEEKKAIKPKKKKKKK